MAYFSTESLVVTTATDGTASAFTVGAFNGFLHSVVFTADGTNPYSNSVVILVTAETSGIIIWSETFASVATTTFSPRLATSTTARVASLYAAAGTAVTDKIPLLGERIKVALTSGGNAKVGTFRFIVGG